MVVQKLLKNPILIIGILFMAIFLFQLSDHEAFRGFFDGYKATSCRSALVMLEKRIPDFWEAKCRENSLNIVIDYRDNTEFMKTWESSKDSNAHRAQIYRALANELVFIAHNTLNESLARVLQVRVRLLTPSFEIFAFSEGKYISVLAEMRSQKEIRDHLAAKVSTREVPL